jgi:hypothetical protein
LGGRVAVAVPPPGGFVVAGGTGPSTLSAEDTPTLLFAWEIRARGKTGGSASLLLGGGVVVVVVVVGCCCCLAVLLLGSSVKQLLGDTMGVVAADSRF